MAELEYNIKELSNFYKSGIRLNNLVNESSPMHDVARECYDSLLKSNPIDNKFYKHMQLGVFANHLNLGDPNSKSKDLNVQSDRAAALIEQSRKRAMQPVVAKNDTTKQTTKPVVTKRRRNTKTSYQPAARAKRLNRSRHMEYKYEMRKLLVDINVPEEHRSNLLGTIWAKGERKTTTDAKDFLLEKMTEGAIDEEQKSRLEKVIDDYTIRR